MGMSLYDLFSIGQHRTRENIAQYDQYIHYSHSYFLNSVSGCSDFQQCILPLSVLPKHACNANRHKKIVFIF